MQDKEDRTMNAKKAELVRIDPRATAQQIVSELGKGLQSAADVYRRYIEAGGDPMELRRHAPVSADLWRTLDDVATGRIDVRLLAAPGTVGRALRMLPKVTQTDAIDNGVELLASDGSAIRVRVHELTSAQSAQVFGPNGVRTVSEQAAWLKGQLPPSAIPKPPPVQFEVKGGKLRVYVPVELSASDLHRILAQMG